MEKQLKAFIYCRVLAPASRNLLNYQEEILTDFADDNNIRISASVKEIENGRTLTFYGMRNLITSIKRNDINIVLVTSKKRIAVYEDLYEEFEMLCCQHGVYIIPLDELIAKNKMMNINF